MDTLVLDHMLNEALLAEIGEALATLRAAFDRRGPEAMPGPDRGTAHLAVELALALSEVLLVELGLGQELRPLTHLRQDRLGGLPGALQAAGDPDSALRNEAREGLEGRAVAAVAGMVDLAVDLALVVDRRAGHGSE